MINTNQYQINKLKKEKKDAYKANRDKLKKDLSQNSTKNRELIEKYAIELKEIDKSYDKKLKQLKTDMKENINDLIKTNEDIFFEEIFSTYQFNTEERINSQNNVEALKLILIQKLLVKAEDNNNVSVIQAARNNAEAKVNLFLDRNQLLHDVNAALIDRSYDAGRNVANISSSLANTYKQLRHEALKLARSFDLTDAKSFEALNASLNCASNVLQSKQLQSNDLNENIGKLNKQAGRLPGQASSWYLFKTLLTNLANTAIKVITVGYNPSFFSTYKGSVSALAKEANPAPTPAKAGNDNLRLVIHTK